MCSAAQGIKVYNQDMANLKAVAAPWRVESGKRCILTEDFHSSLIHFHWKGCLQQQNSICWPDITSGMFTVA